MVPSRTLVRVEPQPATGPEFREAAGRGLLVAATGIGWAFGMDDRLTRLQPGERLRVLRVDASTGGVLVYRLEGQTLARVSQDGLEVLATTYGR